MIPSYLIDDLNLGLLSRVLPNISYDTSTQNL
jgi:hypothetical protein